MNPTSLPIGSRRELRAGEAFARAGELGLDVSFDACVEAATVELDMWSKGALEQERPGRALVAATLERLADQLGSRPSPNRD